MPYSNNLSSCQETYDNQQPPEFYEDDNKVTDLFGDQEKTLEAAYKYIEQQELTDKDIEQLDKALLALPDFLGNVKKWHEKREKEKLKKYPLLRAIE